MPTHLYIKYFIGNLLQAWRQCENLGLYVCLCVSILTHSGSVLVGTMHHNG